MPLDPSTPLRRPFNSTLPTPSTTYTPTQRPQPSCPAPAHRTVYPLVLMDSRGRSRDTRQTSGISKIDWANERYRVGLIPMGFGVRPRDEGEGPGDGRQLDEQADADPTRIERVRQRVREKYVDGAAAHSVPSALWRFGLVCLAVHRPIAVEGAFPGQAVSASTAAATPDDLLIWDIVRARGALPTDELEARKWLAEHKAARDGPRTALGRRIRGRGPAAGAEGPQGAGGGGVEGAAERGRMEGQGGRGTDEEAHVQPVARGKKRKFQEAASGALMKQHSAQASDATRSTSTSSFGARTLASPAAEALLHPAITLLAASASSSSTLRAGAVPAAFAPAKPQQSQKQNAKQRQKQVQTGIMEAGGAVGWVSDKRSASTIASLDKEKGKEKGKDRSRDKDQDRSRDMAKDKSGDKGEDTSVRWGGRKANQPGSRGEEDEEGTAGSRVGTEGKGPMRKEAQSAPALPPSAKRVKRFGGSRSPGAIMEGGAPAGTEPVLPGLADRAEEHVDAAQRGAADLLPVPPADRERDQQRTPPGEDAPDHGGPPAAQREIESLPELSGIAGPAVHHDETSYVADNAVQPAPIVPDEPEHVDEPSAQRVRSMSPPSCPSEISLPPPSFDPDNMRSSTPREQQFPAIFPPPNDTLDAVAAPGPASAHAADETAPSQRARVRRFVLDSDSESELETDTPRRVLPGIAAHRTLVSQASTSAPIASSFADRTEELVSIRIGQAERDLMGALDGDVDEDLE